MPFACDECWGRGVTPDYEICACPIGRERMNAMAGRLLEAFEC